MNSIPGFASAQRAYENMEPPDDECTCDEDGWWTCDDCGLNKTDMGTCPDPDCSGRDLRPLTSEEIAEYYPAPNCPAHGWCGGCSSRYCEECTG
jgi:hypothetical protein